MIFLYKAWLKPQGRFNNSIAFTWHLSASCPSKDEQQKISQDLKQSHGVFYTTSITPEALPMLHTDLSKGAQTLGTTRLANPKQGAHYVMSLYYHQAHRFLFSMREGWVLNTQLPLK